MLAHNYPQAQQQQPSTTSSTQPQPSPQGGQQQQQQQDQLAQHAPTLQSMRLRDEPPPINSPSHNNVSVQNNAGLPSAGTARTSRKRKSPSTVNTADGPPPPPPPPQHHQHPGIPPNFHHILPPPLAPPPGMHPHHPGPMPHPYQYAPGPEYPPPPPQPDQQGQQPGSPTGQNNSGRPLSQSKRAEQNRKAQRAFRERRDQHVKALESRSQLLDAALASADEANRRWEECRALVDQLRIENAALRAALSQMGAQGPPQPQHLIVNAPNNNQNPPTTHSIGQQDNSGEGGEHKDDVAEE